MNLRSEILQFKHIIGSVILDKNPAIRTVVNKLSSIATEFRTFPMEVGELEIRFLHQFLLTLDK